MAYEFSSSELFAIKTAYDNATTGAGTWATVYATIASAITDGGEPKAGVDPAAWVWVNGAYAVNVGSGDYSAFIRTYSSAQYEYRFGTPSQTSLQSVSDGVAKAVADTILATEKMPDLHTIGVEDASASISQYFNGDQSGWSGNPLFLFLGDDSFYRNTILHLTNQNDPLAGDSYDFMTFVKSSIDALGPVKSLSDLAVNVIKTMQTNGLGLLGTTSLVLKDMHESDLLIKKETGSYAATIVSEYTVKLGTNVGQDNLGADDDGEAWFINGGAGDDEIAGNTSPDTLIGGLGNDVVIGGAEIDHIFGGAGNDILVGGNESNIAIGDTIDLTADHRDWNDHAGDILDGGMGNDTYLSSTTVGDTWDWAGLYDINDVKMGSLLKIIDTVDETDGDGVGTIRIQQYDPSADPDQQYTALDPAGNYEFRYTDEFGTSFYSDPSVPKVVAVRNVNIDGSSVPYLFVMGGYPQSPVLAVKNFYQGDFGINLENYVRARPSIGSDVQDRNFQGSSSSELFTGGAGNDSVDYSSSSGSVRIDLASSTGSGASAEGDTFVSIENASGSQFADIIIGNSSDNSLSGGGGDDEIRSGGGNDYLDGGAGNDTIYTAVGEQIVDGGAGDDVLVVSGARSDYTLSAETDQLISIENQAGTSIIATNVEWIRFEDESGTQIGLVNVDHLLASEGKNLIEGSAGTDVLVGSTGADAIFASDGGDTVDAGSGDDLIDGGLGNDDLKGGVGSDTYLYASGDGSDVIDDDVSFLDAGNVDVLKLTNLSRSDVALSRDGDNLKVTINSTGAVITIDNQFLNPDAGFGIETITFADGASINRANILASVSDDSNSGGQIITGTSGDDDLAGTSGDDIFDGGLGNDSMNGGDGSDTYLYRLGDGSDGIGDQSASTTNVDTLKFVDINFADVNFSLSQNDLVATINPTGDVVSIYWQFLDASAGWGLEKMLFADGITMDLKHGNVVWQINGTAGDDHITSPMWGSAEVFNGGKGNDFLDGTAGSDTYLYASGDGSDEINDDVGFLDDGNVDVLKLTDLNRSDIALSRDGSNLRVTIATTGNVITIDNQFLNPDAGFGIEEIDFSDGSSIGRADILASVGDGGNSGDPGNSGGQTITGTSGGDDLTGTSGDDIFDGGLGNDSMNGGDGSDTYLYRLGDGSDGIGDQSASTTNVDTLKFVDINFADVNFSLSQNDLVATINPTGDVVSIYWQFLDASAGWGLEKILFANGITMDLKHGNVVWQINGTAGDDHFTSPMWGSAEIFDGGKGNDFLDGTAGSDTYLYASGDGSDEIDDDVGFLDDGNVDVLKLTDLNQSDIRLQRDGDNLKVTINSTGDIITIDNQFLNPDAGFGIEEIEFADGSSIGRNDIGSTVTNALLQTATAATVRSSAPVILLGDFQDTVGEDHIDLRPLDTDALATGAAVTYDWNADGARDGTAWVGPHDGFLAVDLGEDGQAGPDGVIDQAKELSFSAWASDDQVAANGGSVSDLDGLRLVFDTNHDNVLDANDDRWSEFRVWRDANQNGVADDGELLTMSDAGIKLINLLPTTDGSQSFSDGSAITGTSSYQTADGTTRYLVGDATLAYQATIPLQNAA
ncbi:hypothetical protein N2601_08860 [Rhizobium sp. CB3060]|uniref:beta strand repeat-containing protein n=1 Tax=Rhizobium sp. CB3060 TaxID=3138255 RepID=UPI0021A2E8BD|nr:calcium-binding protein [Rhizobium tropici]UWU23038.1 hypothetical protein N2601_08860 [Rhizobium tropici]